MTAGIGTVRGARPAGQGPGDGSGQGPGDGSGQGPGNGPGNGSGKSPGAGAPRARGPLGRMREKRKQAAWGYLFVAPAILLFALMGVYTIVYGFSLSFAQWNGFWPEWHWKGFKNYTDLLGGSPTYWPIVRKAATNTLWVVIGVPLLTVLVAFPLALVLNSVKRFQGVLRSIYFLPYVTTGIAVYFAWNYILEPNGAINLLLKTVGLGSLQEPQGWLGNPHTALPTMIVVMVWSAVPVAMLLYLTGLQSLDSSLLEAAQIDGAGWLRSTTTVVWPLMKPITVVVILLNVRDSLQGFQSFLIMTNGGPGDSTSVLGLETYRLAFLNELSPTLGLASALGWLLFVAALVVAFINQRAMRRMG